MADRTPTPSPEGVDDDPAADLLNLAAVSRMLHADGRAADEEIELFEELLEAAGLSDDELVSARSWAKAAPSEEAVDTLAQAVAAEGRIEALALAWVTAHADGEIVDEELAEHERLAAAFGLAELALDVRSSVEEGFFSSALTVLATIAAVCRLGEDKDDARAVYEAAVDDMELPGDVAERAVRWFDEPRPLHEVLSEAASLPADFQEGLLGNLWALAQGHDEAEALFRRFEAACGVGPERVRQIQAEWGTDPEETA